mgnify:FL=1
MRPAQAGMFARSLAGHDKGKLFVIVRVEEPYVYLADGKNRLLEQPKKKKLMHVQLDYQQADISSDLEIRKALKAKEV